MQPVSRQIGALYVDIVDATSSHCGRIKALHIIAACNFAPCYSYKQDQVKGGNMTTDALKEKLKELHVALEDAQGVDAELSELLRVLDTDIRALLNKRSSTQTGEAGLATRTQSISARIAANHPKLAPVLRELTDMLASLGI
jgi:hypothetical protein